MVQFIESRREPDSPVLKGVLLMSALLLVLKNYVLPFPALGWGDGGISNALNWLH
jgi:hypothetical protein